TNKYFFKKNEQDILGVRVLTQNTNNVHSKKNNEYTLAITETVEYESEPVSQGMSMNTDVISSATSVRSSELTLTESDQKAELASQVLNDMDQLKQRLYKLFVEGDKDKNGLIDSLEFMEVISKVMPNAPEEDVNNLFTAFDVDKSGMIDYKELLNKNAFHLFITKLFLKDVQVKVIETAKTIADEVVSDVEFVNEDLKEEQVFDTRDLKLIQQQQALIHKLQKYLNETGKPNEEELKQLREDNKILADDNAQLKQQTQDLTQTLVALETESKSAIDQYVARNESLEQEVRTLKEALHSAPKLENEVVIYLYLNYFFSPPPPSPSFLMVESELKLNSSQYKLQTHIAGYGDSGASMTETQVKEMETNMMQMEMQLNERLKQTEDLQLQIGELEKTLAQRTQDVLQRDQTLDSMTQELSKTKNMLFKRMQSSARLKNEVLELEEELEKQDQISNVLYLFSAIIFFFFNSQKHIMLHSCEY
ncbi:hypothetical protein RFI_37991, partial [Reticulomyxa filosa]